MATAVTTIRRGVTKIIKDKFTYRKSGIVFLYIVTPLPIVVTAVASRYQHYGVKNNETDTLI